MAPTILIVGGGFSGVAVAHGLTRLFWPQGLRVVITEKSGRVGRGAAYSTTHASHLLNVPAGRMGALADDEGNFLSWLRRRDASITGDAFVPRREYGDYLEGLLNDAVARAPGSVELVVQHDRVTGIRDGGGQPRAVLESGAEIPYDRLVLATGNLPPRNFSLDDSSFFDTPAYIGDPWAPGALERAAGTTTVLMVGTGLTMVDVALALEHATPGTRFIAVSRHGLLPLSHRDWPTKPVVIEPTRALETWDGSASGLLGIVRREARAAERAGLDWRDVINGLRPLTPSLWRRMPPREQARFYRHIRPFWDTHRHRMSTRVAESINALMARGQLSIVAGRIAACARDGVRVAVDVRRRNGEFARYDVDTVINCTGPCSDLSRVDDPLIAAMRSRGMILPDALGIGIETAADGAVIGRDGRASEILFTLGGTRRPALWESTAVPELRAQADALARRLHRSLGVAAA